MLPTTFETNESVPSEYDFLYDIVEFETKASVASEHDSLYGLVNFRNEGERSA